jgi:hypothetical protein
MKRAGSLMLPLLFLLAFSSGLEAVGLKVGPGGFIIHNVTPGRIYDVYKETGLRLSIYNDDDASHTYLLSAQRPSGEWEKGYLGIPDARWCWFDKSKIVLGAKGEGYGNFYLKIPDEDAYCNQHWIVTLAVTSEPGPGGIALAVNIRAQIETQSRSDVRGTPDGIIAVKPSTLRFENVSVGGAQKGRVTIYNNDGKTHVYKVIPLLHKEGTKPSTYLSHSYQVIPDPGWIMLGNDSLKIKPRSNGALSLKLKIPDKPEYLDKKWEEILLIKPEEGLPGFIRVQICTKEKKAG